MSNSPESEWTTVHTERVPLFRRWRTTARYWARTANGGEAFVRLQRHRLMPWRGRTVTTEFKDREVTA